MTTTDTKTLDLYKLFATDKESEEDGVWVWLEEGKTGFKIRAYNSKPVSDLREKLLKPFQNMIRAGLEIPDEKNEEIGLRVLSGAVLADWKGIAVGGEVVDFSADAAYTLFKELPKLANFVASTSMDSAQFRNKAIEDNAGN